MKHNKNTTFSGDDFNKIMDSFKERAKSIKDAYTYEEEFSRTMTEVSRLALSALAQDSEDAYEEKKKQ